MSVRRFRVAVCAFLGLVLASCGAADQAPESWRKAAIEAKRAVRAQHFGKADTLFAEVLQMAAEDGSESGRLVAIEGLAASHALRGNLGVADSLYSVLLDMQRRRFEADSLSGMALVLTLRSRGEINLSRGLPELAGVDFADILRLDADGAVDLRPEEGTLAFTIEGLGQVRAAGGDTLGADSLGGRATGLKLYAQGFSEYVGDDFDRAEQTLRAALHHQERFLGEHEDLARTAHALGRVYDMRGRRREAARQYELAARVYERIGTSPLDHAAALDDLAAALPADSQRGDGLRQRAAALRAGSPEP